MAYRAPLIHRTSPYVNTFDSKQGISVKVEKCCPMFTSDHRAVSDSAYATPWCVVAAAGCKDTVEPVVPAVAPGAR